MDGAARLRPLQCPQAFLQVVRRIRAWRDTDRLLVLLGGIADPELRLHRFGAHLRARITKGAAWTIAQLWDRVAAGERRAQGICLGLLDSKRLSRMLGVDHLRAAQAVLEAEGDPSAPLLHPARARPDFREEETAPRPKEPVGLRISLAPQPVPRILDWLLSDPDTRVIRTILGNPRLTEADVIKLAASRRAAPEVLEVIAEDARWIARYEVRVALVNNPTTRVRVVLSVLPCLLCQDLRAVAAGAPRAEVRGRAGTLLSQRLDG